MSTILELFPREPDVADEPLARVKKARVQEVEPPDFPEEAIRSLVDGLFLSSKQASIRRVAFASPERDAVTTHLCYATARILAQQASGNVALVDASVDGASFDHLNLASWNGDSECRIAEHFWAVHRSAWLEAGGDAAMTARCVSRLREVTSKFDFSIFSCGMLDSATITIGGECDGLVLVLTANTTRRLVASRMKECLLQAGIPLIGTVLAERRFPIPERIYRVL